MPVYYGLRLGEGVQFTGFTDVVDVGSVDFVLW